MTTISKMGRIHGARLLSSASSIEPHGGVKNRAVLLAIGLLLKD